jgi:putative membrane protein
MVDDNLFLRHNTKEAQMKDLAEQFLSEDERARVSAAVKKAEKRTAGEIVVMIIPASYHYPMANVIGAAAFALVLGLLLTPFIGGWLWIGNQNMWLLLGLFTVFFILFHEAIKRTRWLKRYFISRKEIDTEVKEAAVTHFFEHGLYRTRDKTGVLVLISVFERRVRVLADEGINAQVAEGQWDEIVKMITDGIKQRRPADAICLAVEKIGELLKAHFPIRPDDTDELKNVIID